MVFRRDDDGREFYRPSLGSRLFAPVYYLVDKFKELTDEDQSGFREEVSGGQRVLEFLTFPIRLVWAFGFFLVMAWTTSRNGFAFLRGGPAVGVAVTLLLALWASENLVNRSAIAIARYQYYVRNTPDNPGNALMFAKKMVELRPEESVLKFELGLSQQRMRSPEAINIMQELAGRKNDRDPEGVANANIWLARYYARKSVLESDSEKYQSQIENYLIAAHQVQPDNLFALIHLADFYQSKQDLKEAVKYLELLVADRMRNELQIRQYPRLIQLKKELDEIENADVYYQSAINKVQPIARRYPDRYQIWFSLVQCAVLAKDYDGANEIILDGYQMARDRAVRDKIVRLASAIMITKADDFPDLDDERQYKARLYALSDAVRRNPRNREAYTRLVEFAIINEETEQRGYWLREAILDSTNPAVIHVLLGMHEISRGNFVRAQEQWKIAEHEFESTQFVVNNMIEVATADYPDQIGNLMDMVTVAIELFDRQPILYQTRATYLMQQEQWEDAVKDLQYTISQMPNLVTARKKLIDCYEQLGQKSEADAQRDALDSILVQLDDEQRKLVEEVLNR